MPAQNGSPKPETTPIERLKHAVAAFAAKIDIQTTEDSSKLSLAADERAEACTLIFPVRDRAESLVLKATLEALSKAEHIQGLEFFEFRPTETRRDNPDEMVVKVTVPYTKEAQRDINNLNAVAGAIERASEDIPTNTTRIEHAKKIIPLTRKLVLLGAKLPGICVQGDDMQYYSLHVMLGSAAGENLLHIVDALTKNSGTLITQPVRGQGSYSFNIDSASAKLDKIFEAIGSLQPVVLEAQSVVR